MPARKSRPAASLQSGRIVLWVLLGAAFLVAAAFLAWRYGATDRLLAIYLTYSPSLPPWVSFEHFLAAGLAGCLLALGLCGGSGMVGFAVLLRRLQLANGRRSLQESRIQQEYERLMELSAMLTQRLDKRAILQQLLQAASQLTSLPHTDSAVALWVTEFERGDLRFETGIRCDETFFTRQQLPPTEPPFARLVSGKQALRFGSWREGMPFVSEEKIAQLGEANALLLAPLFIERTVLGCLAIFCHPQVLAETEQRQTFYSVIWGQLALALAIAIQGELAILDRLTGVVNQAYFLKRLTQELDRCNRYELPLSLLMVDVDNFKTVNDSLGHQQGDAVLRIVSGLIKKAIRTVDLVGRYGGDEFIVMMPETGFPEDPSAMPGSLVAAERIRKSVEEEFRQIKQPLAVTTSIGIAIRRFPQERHLGVRDLIRLADEQLYKAKTAGRNRCCLFVPPTEASETAAPSAPPGTSA